jgi:hypothetical protein
MGQRLKISTYFFNDISFKMGMIKSKACRLILDGTIPSTALKIPLVKLRKEPKRLK